jgi:hypothetical protein
MASFKKLQEMKNYVSRSKTHFEVNRYLALEVKRELMKQFGGKCKTCGYSSNINALDFHHRVPFRKSFNISRTTTLLANSRMPGSRDIEALVHFLKSEVKKCDLLCCTCHREEISKNYIEIDEEFGQYKRNCSLKIQHSKNGELFKFCPHCRRLRNVNKFRTYIDGKTGSTMFGGYCEECLQIYNHSRRSLKKECVEYLGGKCIKCGYSNKLNALDFHHRDPNTKSFNVSVKLQSRWSMDKLIPELDKCDLVCCRCHREIHYPDGDIDSILEKQDMISLLFYD